MPKYVPPTDTVTLRPTIMPTEIPTHTIVPDPIDPSTGWRIHTDMAGFSFQYPTTWKSVGHPRSRGARIVPINNPHQYSRAIIFQVEDNPHNHPLTSAEVTRGESFAPEGGYKDREAIPTEPFTVGSIEGVRLLKPYAGTLEVIYIAYGNDVIQILLSGGGAHGGYDSESLPTAEQDRELFFKVLQTFKP